MTTMGADFNSIEVEQARKEQEALAMKLPKIGIEMCPIDEIRFGKLDPVMSKVVAEMVEHRTATLQEEAMHEHYKLPPDQTIKADAGKPPLSMVPMQIVFDIATIRAYGNAKYKDPWSWKRVDMERYVDAMLRHALAFAMDYISRDEESGLPHLHHLACNVAFLCDMLKEDFKDVQDRSR
jgi:Domain of unknown function (DUF5664)